MATGLQLKAIDAPNTTFHVTQHGIGDLKVFERPRDKAEFLARIAQHLSPQETRDRSRRPHAKLFDAVTLLAYCVLDNHFHLVLHQFTATGMRDLMHRVTSSYGRHINCELGRRGAVFDGRYAAKRLDESNPEQARNMIAYTELNDPILQFDNPFGSHQVIGLRKNCDWVDREKALAVFGGRDGYRAYMNRRGPAVVEAKLRKWGVDPSLHPYRPI